MSVEAIISSQPPAPSSEITPPPVLTGVFKEGSDTLGSEGILTLVKKPSVYARTNLSTGIDITRIGWLKRGGRGRGPCGACDSGQQEGHHGGSRCRRRGTLGFNLTSWQSPISINKLPSKSPGFR